MIKYGVGNWEVSYTADDGREFVKHYRTTAEANKAQAFLKGLGITASIKPLKQQK